MNAMSGDFITNFVRGGFDEGFQGVKNFVEINVQLFDPGTEKAGWGWDLLSRFTWEGLNTLIGYVASDFVNTFGNVNDVEFYRGVTVLRTGGEWGGITFGNYIIGDHTIKADPDNPLFQHEFGHYLQSKETGNGYYFIYGIPSLLNTKSKSDHRYFWAERDANKRSFIYFSPQYSNISWNTYIYPLFPQGDDRNIYDPSKYTYIEQRRDIISSEGNIRNEKRGRRRSLNLGGI